MRFTPPQSTTERDLQDGARYEVDRLDHAVVRPFGAPKRLYASGAVGYGQIALIDPSEAALTVTLPPVARGRAGELILIKNNTDSTNAITILAAGSDEIDGESSLELSTARAVALLFCAPGEGWVRL